MTDVITSLLEIFPLILGSGFVGAVIFFFLNWYYYKFPKIVVNLRILDFSYNRDITIELEVRNDGDTLASRIIGNFSPNWGNSQTINIPDLDPNEKFTKNITVKIGNVYQDLSIYTNFAYIRKLWKIKLDKVIEVRKTVKLSVDHQKSHIIFLD